LRKSKATDLSAKLDFAAEILLTVADALDELAPYFPPAQERQHLQTQATDLRRISCVQRQMAVNLMDKARQGSKQQLTAAKQPEKGSETSA
jgi:hypothetical protein